MATYDWWLWYWAAALEPLVRTSFGVIVDFFSFSYEGKYNMEQDCPLS